MFGVHGLRSLQGFGMSYERLPTRFQGLGAKVWDLDACHLVCALGVAELTVQVLEFRTNFGKVLVSTCIYIYMYTACLQCL